MSNMVLMIDIATGDVFPAWKVCEGRFARVMLKEKSGQYKPWATSSKLKKIEEKQGCEIFKVIDAEEVDGLPEPELIKAVGEFYKKTKINLETVNRELEKFYENVCIPNEVCKISEGVEGIDECRVGTEVELNN